MRLVLCKTMDSDTPKHTQRSRLPHSFFWRANKERARMEKARKNIMFCPSPSTSLRKKIQEKLVIFIITIIIIIYDDGGMGLNVTTCHVIPLQYNRVVGKGRFGGMEWLTLRSNPVNLSLLMWKLDLVVAAYVIFIMVLSLSPWKGGQEKWKPVSMDGQDMSVDMWTLVPVCVSLNGIISKLATCLLPDYTAD